MGSFSQEAYPYQEGKILLSITNIHLLQNSNAQVNLQKIIYLI